MFGNVGRKLVEGTVGLFALLGFLYVPLGRHTGFEHAQAVLSTPQASAAIEDLTNAALRLRERAFELFTGHLSPPSPSPAASAQHAPRLPNAEIAQHGPKPVAPKLK